MRVALTSLSPYHDHSFDAEEKLPCSCLSEQPVHVIDMNKITIITQSQLKLYQEKPTEITCSSTPGQSHNCFGNSSKYCKKLTV